MSANALLSTVILVSFIVTIVLAVGSYMAYKYRERRQPKATFQQAGDGPIFFERFFPQKPVVASAPAGTGEDDDSRERSG
jgi:heme/copper-type cytochrome/quinol oxidase subunit 2